MCWDSSWPLPSGGKIPVSSGYDSQYISAAQTVQKSYMMPMSNLQFKHLDSSQNWYRRGELDLSLRIPQVLSLQPTFVEFQTWNDAGESSYIGNIWPDQITGSAVHNYTDNFSHTGWQNVLTPFIAAYKAGATDSSAVIPLNGAAATGAIWYRTILTSATCVRDPLGKPQDSSIAEDNVNVAILLSAAAAGATVNVYS